MDETDENFNVHRPAKTVSDVDAFNDFSDFLSRRVFPTYK